MACLADRNEEVELYAANPNPEPSLGERRVIRKIKLWQAKNGDVVRHEGEEMIAYRYRNDETTALFFRKVVSPMKEAKDDTDVELVEESPNPVIIGRVVNTANKDEVSGAADLPPHQVEFRFERTSATSGQLIAWSRPYGVACDECGEDISTTVIAPRHAIEALDNLAKAVAAHNEAATKRGEELEAAKERRRKQREAEREAKRQANLVTVSYSGPIRGTVGATTAFYDSDEWAGRTVQSAVNWYSVRCGLPLDAVAYVEGPAQPPAPVDNTFVLSGGNKLVFKPKPQGIVP